MATNGIFSAIKDLAMTDDGDLILDDDRLATVTGIDWFTQEVNKILRTNNPEWRLHPTVGADLEDFIGKNNTREVGKAIEDRLYVKLSEENIQLPGKLNVKVTPIDKDRVHINIILFINGTSINITKSVFELNNGIFRSLSIDNDTNINVPIETTDFGKQKINPYIRRIK